MLTEASIHLSGQLHMTFGFLPTTYITKSDLRESCVYIRPIILKSLEKGLS